MNGHPMSLCENGAVSTSTFALTDVQRDFRDDPAHLLPRRRWRPTRPRSTATREFPWKSFEACKEMELPALGIPEAYGGAGADTVTQAIAVEELARVCASTVADHPHLQARDAAGHELGRPRS